MANSRVWFRELRFLVKDETLEVYVFCECPSFDLAHGWRHKTFGPSMSVLDFMQDWNAGKEDPLMWDVGAPR